MSHRYLDSHDGARTVGIDLYVAAELQDPLAHTPEPNAERSRHFHLMPLFWRYALASVRHFNQNEAIESSQANLGGRTPGMTMDIGQALLHYSKNGRFQLLGEPAEIIRELGLNLNLAALCKSLNVPPES